MAEHIRGQIAALDWGCGGHGCSDNMSDLLGRIDVILDDAALASPAAPRPEGLDVDPQPMTEAVAVVVHRWKHPTYRMGEQGCRCREDATMAVDVALSEGLVASPAAPGWPRCQDGYDLRTEVCPVCSPAAPRPEGSDGIDVDSLADAIFTSGVECRVGGDWLDSDTAAAIILARLADTGDTP